MSSILNYTTTELLQLGFATSAFAATFGAFVGLQFTATFGGDYNDPIGTPIYVGNLAIAGIAGMINAATVVLLIRDVFTKPGSISLAMGDVMHLDGKALTAASVVILAVLLGNAVVLSEAGKNANKDPKYRPGSGMYGHGLKLSIANAMVWAVVVYERLRFGG